MLKKRLLTNIQCVKRGAGHDSSCLLCGYATKDILHVVRDCLVVKDVWSQVIPVNHHDIFFLVNLQDWFVSNS